MNEQAAYQVTLVRAIEENDGARQVLSDHDRLYASRSAMELARWQVADQQSSLTPALFLQKRAEQVLIKLTERQPTLDKLTHAGPWFTLALAALPVLALLGGALADRIADPRRVDLLSPPLLLILLWNAVVYAGLLVWGIKRRLRPGSPTPPRWARWLRRTPALASELAPALASGLALFARDWLTLSAPLTQARLSRALHLSAALFAVGAIGSLLVRGLFTQYLATWESTFLSASQVHALLQALFAPATALLSLPGFTLAEVQALRHAPSPDTGAQWVLLYAATLLLFVVLPRLGLSLWAWRQERRLRAHFPLPLGLPYFRKLTAHLDDSAPARVQVFPYSFTVSPTLAQGLSTLAQALLGESARVDIQASTAYGDESQTPVNATTPPTDEAPVALTVALFNLSATPERENHGEFLDRLRQASGRPVLAWVDESAYQQRVGASPGGAQRLAERMALWRQFGELHHVQVSIVNLLQPQARQGELERDAASALPAP